jgi:hypothetical protein
MGFHSLGNAEVPQLLLTTCMHHGQTAYIVDYIQSVCADPKLARGDKQSAAEGAVVLNRQPQELADPAAEAESFQ